MNKHILIISNTIDAGGAETFVMKVLRCLHGDGVCFDFLINKKDSTFYLEEIRRLGGSVFCGYPKSRHPIKSFLTVYRTIKQGGYKTVFCIAVHPVGFLDLLAAALAGAKVRLTRSTNSNTGGKASALLAFFCKPLIRLLSTEMLAPSREAGNWLFGSRAVEDGRVRIITNGIDMDMFAFDSERRAQARAALGIPESTFLVGHVGRFNAQKNHRQLLDIFREIRSSEPNSRLLLVGDGTLREETERLAEQLGLADTVLFPGIRKDVPDLLMAMDALVFPSLYEGLPNVVVEAQAVGLPCFLSDTISPEVQVTPLVHFLSLADSAQTWGVEVLQAKGLPRTDMRGLMAERGYSIENTAGYLAGLFA